MLEAGRIFELAEQRQPVPPGPLGAGVLRGCRSAEKWQSEAVENGRQGCKGAGVDEETTGQAQRKPPQGQGWNTRIGRIMSQFGSPGTDMCATGPSLYK